MSNIGDTVSFTETGVGGVYTGTVLNRSGDIAMVGVLGYSSTFAVSLEQNPGAAVRYRLLSGNAGIRRDGLAVDRSKDVLPKSSGPVAAGRLVEAMNQARDSEDYSPELIRVICIKEQAAGNARLFNGAEHVIIASDGEALADFWERRTGGDGFTYTVKVREMPARELYAYLYEPVKG
jgi:hypothetical protein